MSPPLSEYNDSARPKENKIPGINTVFLSENGVERVVDIFSRVRKKNINQGGDTQEIVGNSLINVDWNDFDSIYLGIYTRFLYSRIFGWKQANMLLNPNKSYFSEFIRKAPGEALVQVEFLLDIDFKGDNEYFFIDEYAVRAVMLFRKIFSHTISFDNVVTRLDTGCALLSICARVPNVSRLGEMYKIKGEEDVGEKLIRSRLSDEKWEAIKKRFSVVDESIKNLPW